MPIIPDAATFQKSLAMLPISTYEPGEMIIAAGATTGQLLLLRQGVVEVLREGTQIARISEPGSVFGELAVLLDKPHTADVRAVERSVFSVADGATLLTSDPAATLYIAAILALRLDAANVALIEIKRQLEEGKPRVFHPSDFCINYVRRRRRFSSAAHGRHRLRATFFCAGFFAEPRSALML